jgi:HK97 family phage portal protein
MAWWNPFSRGVEARGAIPPARENVFQVLFGGDYQPSSTGVNVTIEVALTVPAVAAAINFIAETMASLPLEIYSDGPKGRSQVKGGLANLLSGAVNDELTSYEWRKQLFVNKLSGGRGLTYIERNEAGTIINLWPMDPLRTIVKLKGWSKVYEYTAPNGQLITYRADEVIDLPFMLASDGLTHRSPIHMGREAIGLAVAATQYGAKFLANGGVPPFVVTGNFQSPAAMKLAADDFDRAVRKAATEARQALTVPTGIEVKPIGADPEKSQLVELQRFCIEQVARIFQLPPTFLQDLTHGTYSNTEQQDLHFAKHTVLHHVEQFEQELNLKIFGRRSNSKTIELEMDGLLRGDFKTRMEGWARAIQSGLVTPNEARADENYPALAGGDKLMMQGATVPIDTLGAAAPAPTSANGGMAE